MHPRGDSLLPSCREGGEYMRGLARCFFGVSCAMAAVLSIVFLVSAIVHNKQSRRWSWLIFLLGMAATGSVEDPTKVLKEEAVARLEELGKISDSNAFLQRTFLSPAAIRAGHLIQEWMEDAGLYTWVDDIGNVHGRTECGNASAPALVFGSHLDTVIDAGKYDGALGLVSAIAAVKMLDRTGRLKDFVRPIEIIAFSDEEGVRFQSTFLGSGAIAGLFQPHQLALQDRSGVTLESSLKSYSLGTLVRVKYAPQSVWGYVEVHIEQGPVLEAQGIPLGIVEAIAGQTRYRVRLQGSQGHAGTVPMTMRKDPMPAAAQSIVTIERLCREAVQVGNVVCTVGEIYAWPGASNVIPGEVTFTVDLRATDDLLRDYLASQIEGSVHGICADRGLSCNILKMHEAKSVRCDEGLMRNLKQAAESTVLEINKGESSIQIPSLMSGAGHDAMAMAHLTKVGMLFVRCKGGISHSPAESVTEDDIFASAMSTLHFLNQHSEEHKQT